MPWVSLPFQPLRRDEDTIDLDELRARLRKMNDEDLLLPETGKGRWGDGLTADVITKCVWVRPERVAQIEFLEWTDGSFVSLEVRRTPQGQGCAAGGQGADLIVYM